MTEPGSRTGLYVTLIVVLIAVLAVLGYFIGRDIGLFGGSKTLTVPNVARLSAANAQTELSESGFTDVTRSVVTSSTVAEGDAVGTTPAYRSREKADTHIVLDVSGGPASVVLPKVDGVAQKTAVAALHAAGFTTAIKSETSPSVPAGDVIATDPPGGQKVAPKIKVTVIVSTGVQQVAIPSVTNDDVAAATLTLAGKGFSPTQRSQASNTIKSGSVIGTSPPAGSLEPHGSSVVILVSTGPSMATVPPLNGLTQSAAGAALKADGLTGSFTTVSVASASQNGLVQGPTTPPAGTSVRTGSTVTVPIGSYTAPSTTTSSSTTSTTSTTLPGGTTTTSPSTSPSSVPKKHNRTATGLP